MQAKKSLGQHFLRCEWVVDELIAAADLRPSDTVLEIGPGTGILTVPLAKHAGRVIAVEKDDALADALRGKNFPRVEIVKGDILSLFQTKSGISSRLSLECYKVVANIPYYLTSRLLRLLIEGDARPERIVLTIQKEVAERIIAVPPDMNLLALSVEAYGTPRLIALVPPSCFAPSPDVESAIISISDISDNFFRKNALDAQFFFKVLHAAFGQKRKQLANPLAAIAGGKEKALAALKTAGLDPRVRPQELSLAQWATLITGLSQ